MSQRFQALVFIDANVADVYHLLNGVRPGYQVQVLTPDQDGVAQITAALQATPAREVHIISHGAPGTLALGNSQLSLATLLQYSTQLKTWFSDSHPHSANALYLYGCNVAAGDAGAEFLTKLHHLTGAAIGASTSRVGNAAQGGNWYLDVAIGSLMQPVAIAKQAQRTYSGIFADIEKTIDPDLAGLSDGTDITDGSSVAITFNMSAASPSDVVDNITLGLRISSFSRGDLTATLESPEGTQITLINTASDTNDNYDILLTDASGAAANDLTSDVIGAGVNPYDRNVGPVQPLSTFDGETIDGTWTLRIFDTSANASATVFREATLTITPLNNEAPVFAPGTYEVEYNENSTGEVIAITVTDADIDDDISLSLTGEDAGRFIINDNGDGTASIVPDGAIDLEGEGSTDGDDIYEFNVVANDGKATTTQAVNVTIQNRNDQPTAGTVELTSDGDINNPQTGDTLTASVDTLTITDQDGLPVTPIINFTWERSSDGTNWTAIAGATGENYTLLGDDVNNQVRVVANYTDAGTFSPNLLFSTGTSAVALAPNDPPVFDAVSPVEFEENDTGVVVDVNATDDDTPITYSLNTTVGDNALFDIDPTTGEVTFNTAPNFEQSSDVNSDNTYEIQITATDNLGASSTQDLTVTVTDVSEVPVNTGDDLGETISLEQDADYIFSTARGNAITVDDADLDETLDIVLSVVDGKGILTLGSIGGLNVTGNGTSFVEITGASQAQVNAALEGLTYSPLDDFIGTASFKIDTSDAGLNSDSDTVTFDITNINDEAIIAGDLEGSVIEGSQVTATGTATVEESDSDLASGGSESFIEQTNTPGDYGNFSINADGEWTYTYTGELAQDASETDTFTITAADGTTKQVAIAITGANDTPTITGDTNVSGLEEDTTVFLSGALDIADPDDEAEEAFVQSQQPGNYGTFKLATTGNWTYTLANTSDAVQALGEGENVQDEFTITTADGTTQTFTVNILGKADEPTITGALAGEVKEGDNPSTTGEVTVVDADANESFVQPLTDQVGVYGKFTIAADGLWSYTLDTNLAAPLAEGEEATDTFTVTTEDGTTEEVVIAVEGSNNGAEITFTAGSNQVELTEADPSTVGGDFDINDPDEGESEFQAIAGQQGDYGTFSVTTEGTWNYSLDEPLDELRDGDSVVDTFTVTSKDSTVSETVTITIAGENDAATISVEPGDASTGDVTEDTNPTASGTLSISDIDQDVDTNEAQFKPITSADTESEGNYGTFTIDSAGNWSYTLDDTLAEIQSLAAGESPALTESFAVESFDGTDTEVITINIEGSNDAPTVNNSVTATFGEDDASGVVNLLTNATDTDTNDTLSIKNLSPSESVPGITDNGDGTLTVDPSAYSSLGRNDSKDIVYTYDITDGSESTSQTLTITIEGKNDAPEVTALPINVTVSENNDAFTIDLASVITDADESDVLGISLINAEVGNNTDGISRDGTVLTIDPSAYKALADGESEEINYTYRITDGLATTTDITATITITGANNAPEISGDTTGEVTELNDATTELSATGNLEITDPDQVPTDQAEFVTGTADPGTGNLYGGALSIEANGAWTYTVDNANLEALSDGDTATESFTVKSVDNTEQVITITLKGANDETVIGGDLNKEVQEDSFPSTLIVSGTLTGTDPDGDDNAFTADTFTGTYGKLTLQENGTWEYTADNTQEALQALRGGASPGQLSDAFEVKSADGTPATVTVTIIGNNDVPEITGEASGTIVEDANPSVSGQLNVDDTDAGESAFVPATLSDGGVGTYGTLIIEADGAWEYTADETAIQSLAAEQTEQETFTVETVDGTVKTITIAIEGTSGPAQFTGDFSGEVTEDSDALLTVSGTITVDDEDAGADALKATTYSGLYGTLITTAGGWTYEADNEQQAIQELTTSGESLEDVFDAVESVDGTKTTITVTIKGVDDDAVIRVDAAEGESQEGSINEDETTVVEGKMTVLDPDLNQGGFQAVANGEGTYGTFTIATDGSWTYTLDNSAPGVQALANGQEVTDTFTFTSIDEATQETVEVIITGVNDTATITGSETTGTAIEDVTIAPITGSLTVNDVDTNPSDEGKFLAVNVEGTYGTFVIAEDGEWAYTFANTFAQGAAVQALPQQGEGDPDVTETFTVTSADGTATETVTITVIGANDTPTIAGDLNTKAVTEGNANDQGFLTQSGTLTIDDPDGENSFTAGDYSGSAGGTLTLTTDGSWTYKIADDLDVVDELSDGTSLDDEFEVTAIDGTTATVTVTINGANDQPTLEGDVEGSVTEDTNVITVDADKFLRTSGTIAFNDPDQTPVDQSGFKVDSLGDVVVTPSAGAIGNLVVNPTTGAWTYEVDNTLTAVQELSGQEGDVITETFEVTSKDNTKTATITITINGTDDDATIEGDNVGRLTEGDPTFEFSADLDVVDQDSVEQGFVAQTDTLGDYGSFSIQEDGTWTYTLNNDKPETNALAAGEEVFETFEVSAADNLTTATVTVFIEGANDAPSLVEGASETLNISATEDFTVTNIKRGVFTTGFDDPENGFLSVKQNGTQPFVDASQGELVDNGNGTFTFTPAENFEGEVTVTYVVSDGALDGSGDSAPVTKTFTVAHLNDAPELTETQATLSDRFEDDTVTFDVGEFVTGFTDVDGDTLDVSKLRLGNAGAGTIAKNGNTITYTPTANFFGEVEVLYSVIDGNGGEYSNASLTFNVIEENDVPQGSPTGTIIGPTEDTVETFDIQRSALLAGFTDADNIDNLVGNEDTLTITSINVDIGTIDIGDGLGPFTYTPVDDYSGDVEITYSFTDGRGGNVLNQKRTFTIAPSNDDPVLTGTPGEIADGLEDDPVTFSVNTLLQGYTDVDGDSLEVQGLTLSEGFGDADIAISLDEATGTYTYTPPENVNGTVTLTYIVADNAGGTVEASKTFDLAPLNDAPEAPEVGLTLADIDENDSLPISEAELLAGYVDPDTGDNSGLSVSSLVVSEGAGEITQDGSGFIFTPLTGFAGTVVLTYTVTDGDLSAPGTVTFEVGAINDAPAGDVTITGEPKQGIELGVNFGDLTDQDGLTNAQANSFANAKYQWEASASLGTEANWQPITEVLTGTEGGATFTPGNDLVNSYIRVIVEYQDDKGFTNTVMSLPAPSAIADANDPPTAGDLTGEIAGGEEDTPFTIKVADLLAGFSDPDGDGTLFVQDLELIPSGLIGAPLEEDVDGNLLFTPADDQFGEVTLTYTVSDGEFSIENIQRTFTIAPVNDAPTVSSAIAVELSEDAKTAKVNLVANASDIDNTELTTDLTLADPIPGFSVTGSALNIDPSAYDSLAEGETKEFVFDYNVIDGADGAVAQTATITIMGANDAPEGLATAELSPSLQNTDRVINASVLLEGFTDPDGDTLSITNPSASSGAVEIGENGNLLYDPVSGFVGKVTLNYEVTDGTESIEATQTFELKSNQVPPNVFNYQQYVQFNTLAEGIPYSGPSLALEIGQVTLSAIFDETYYLEQNVDIRNAVNRGVFQSGYEHFVNFGINEGRNPSLYYNEDIYLAANQDVANAIAAGDFASGLAHYLQYGHLEERVASNLFDPSDYLTNNPDIGNAIARGEAASAFQHFVEFGAAEGRQSALLFEESYYLEQNPDVARAVARGDFSSGYEHYVLFGQKEANRDPGPLFDESSYLGSNPDIARAVAAGADVSGFASGFEHFFRFGRAEDRPLFTPQTFDTTA